MSLVLIFIVIILSFLYKNVNINYKKPRPPGPLSYPIIGNLYSVLTGSVPKTLFEYYRRYGPIYQLQYGNTNVVVLSEYSIQKEAFVDNSDVFNERLVLPSRKFKAQENITNSNGIVWRKLHAIATSELLPNMKIKRYEPMILDEVNKLSEIFRERARLGVAEDPTQAVKVCYLNIIIGFLFGFRFEDYQDPKITKFVNLVHIIFRRGANPIISDYIPIMSNLDQARQKELFNIFNEFYSFITEIAEQKLKSIDLESTPTCYLELLLIKYKANELTWGEVIKSSTDILLAGSDTAGLYTLHTIRALANRPEIQEKVFEEISKVYGKNGIISYSSKSKTPYLNAVMKETERRYTISPIALPHTANKDIFIGGYFIPKDSYVLLNIYASHLNNKDWDEPMEFNPDRFIKDESLDRRLLTFGMGSRNCLGFQYANLQVYLIIASLLRSFKFSTVSPDTKIPEESEPGTTLAPNPFKVVCSLRN